MGKFKTTFTTIFIFLGPSLFSISFFFVFPVALALLISMTDFDIYSLGNLNLVRFIGIENYKKLFADPLFWKSLLNTFYFVFIGGPISIFVSLLSAIFINSKITKFKKLIRFMFFAPVVTTLVAVAIVWRYLYHPRFGAFNYFLSIFGINPINWLGDPRFAMPAIILLAVWKNFGYNMLIFLAGLQNIPEELYEAAKIDGASAFQQFKNITLPMLAPTTLFVTLTTMIGYFQLFAEPYVMTQGGPMNSTLSIVLLMYQHGFRWWNMGYSTTIAFSLFLVILAFS
ncbi:carbohydrate ABC transporter permease, partial [Candidatus Kryptobacter tengchongensis]